MRLVDSHCHLNKELYNDGLDGIFSRAAENSVGCMLFASSDVATSMEAVCTANMYKCIPNIYAAVGVHPHEAAKVSSDYIDEIETLSKDSRVLAIGEIGLDYFYDISPREVQRKVFAEQLELAKRAAKPVVIHVRDSKSKSDGDAASELLHLLREHGAEKCGGVIHCFSGNAKEARSALELGFYISFAGPITYPSNRVLREIAADIPIDRILCETDSPYLAPQGYRGKRNEPRHVRSVYECIAMLRGMSVDKFADIVCKNFERAFHIV
ncbi:MAG: TatD family hydrolase [Synergistes sp.]|nr:TatD family hydrolase [Synergistes sp.]